jgi:hypothetical protein
MRWLESAMTSRRNPLERGWLESAMTSRRNPLKTRSLQTALPLKRDHPKTQPLENAIISRAIAATGIQSSKIFLPTFLLLIPSSNFSQLICSARGSYPFFLFLFLFLFLFFFSFFFSLDLDLSSLRWTFCELGVLILDDRD